MSALCHFVAWLLCMVMSFIRQPETLPWIVKTSCSDSQTERNSLLLSTGLGGIKTSCSACHSFIYQACRLNFGVTKVRLSYLSNSFFEKSSFIKNHCHRASKSLSFSLSFFFKVPFLRSLESLHMDPPFSYSDDEKCTWRLFLLWLSR